MQRIVKDVETSDIPMIPNPLRQPPFVAADAATIETEVRSMDSTKRRLRNRLENHKSSFLAPFGVFGGSNSSSSVFPGYDDGRVSSLNFSNSASAMPTT